MPVYLNQPQPTNIEPTPVTPEGRRRQGTGFTNIQNLLQANVGAGGIMGKAVGTGMGQKAGQLKQDVTAAGQKFQEQFKKEQEKAAGQIGAVGGYLSGQQDLSSLTPEEAEKIGKQMRETQYGGLQQLENQQALLSRAGNIQALGTLAGMGAIGQGRLLQGIATRRGGYSRGQGLLDQYLVGQDVGAQKQIRDAAAESYGAAQQAQTEASVAEQQAQGLAKSIEEQKTQTQQDVLKQLAGRQEEATQSAKQYLNQADRIKKILTGDIKPEEITEEDRLAMSDLSKYGVDTQTITTADDPQTILNALANAGITQFTGQQRYLTDAQQKAAKNLALLSGQEDVAKKIADTKFDPKIFEKSNKDIEAGVASSQAIDQTYRNQLNLNENITQPEIQNILTDVNRTLSLKDATSNKSLSHKGTWGNPDSWIDEVLNKDEFSKNAARYLGAGTVKNIMRNRYWRDDIYGHTEYALGQMKNAVEDILRDRSNKLNVLNNRYLSKKSLQDYINERFSITPLQQGS